MNPVIIEGDESLVNPSSMRGAVSRSRAWGMLAVMNPSVADVKWYALKHEATDRKNGSYKWKGGYCQLLQVEIL